MSLNEKSTRVAGKVASGYKMVFDLNSRKEWLERNLEIDLKEGVINLETSQKILKQAQKPHVGRHIAEIFLIPLGTYAVTVPAAAYVLYYAWETNDPWAWGYTASHLFHAIPKLSPSSVIRAAALGGSILYDRIIDRNIGSKKQNLAETTAIGISAVSWMGIGNAGPFLRMVATDASPDLGRYMGRKFLTGRGRDFFEKRVTKSK